MKFTILRELLIKIIYLVVTIVENKQTLNILSNIFLKVKDKILTISSTDLEIELTGYVKIYNIEINGNINIPAYKLLKICKSLSPGAKINIFIEETNRVVIKSGYSIFRLSTLSYKKFPKLNNIKKSLTDIKISIKKKILKKLIDYTYFAMANKDIRYYLNGMLIEICKNILSFVATDGHRMAICSTYLNRIDNYKKIIIPRKSIIKIKKLLNDNNNDNDIITIIFGSNYINLYMNNYLFTSKLIYGNFPDYKNLILINMATKLFVNRKKLLKSISRISVILTEKNSGIILRIINNKLIVQLNNIQKDEAEENIKINYKIYNLEIGLNINYLIDILNVFDNEYICIIFSKYNKSILVIQEQNNYFYKIESKHIIMAMLL
ncbi:DNA polymerase III subunit beta [Candidatus Johnevansia muelleri]|uniref:Beta sliding clamp n=1 Tax=Candidatus Johnevansia muelleri TaxID=1495769 RepID=A0A078KHY0_9GAMM|nr:DNA polymerase III subunit beta [Candidatus Evansia muelleri]